MPNPTKIPLRALQVVPFHMQGWPTLVDWLCDRLERSFRIVVRVRAASFDPETAFDRARGQYNSRVLLSRLLDQRVPSNTRLLGVTSVDLFMPVLTYVFGEAQLGGQAAVVSLHRLRAEAYGLRRDEELLKARVLKEAVHEVGHTCGLLHCRDNQCVMHASTYAEEIDLKSASFCRRCQAGVRTARSA